MIRYDTKIVALTLQSHLYLIFFNAVLLFSFWWKTSAELNHSRDLTHTYCFPSVDSDANENIAIRCHCMNRDGKTAPTPISSFMKCKLNSVCMRAASFLHEEHIWEIDSRTLHPLLLGASLLIISSWNAMHWIVGSDRRYWQASMTSRWCYWVVLHVSCGRCWWQLLVLESYSKISQSSY